MRFNFRKVSAIASSLLMVGLTAGVAAAAQFPAPFSSSASSGVGIVSGTGAGVDDTVATTSISNYLATQVKTSGGTPLGGDSYKFEKTSRKFQLGDNITGVISSAIDEDELPTLLADGKFVDNDNNEFDYTQKITIAATSQLTMFDDDDYATDSPTVGFRILSGANVMTYTLSFSDEPLVKDLTTTDLPFMGKNYYVLSNSTSGANLVLTLLDSAEDTVLEEGSSAVVSGKSVTIDFISSTEVALIVDGESTNTLQETETQKLTDGSYVGIKDIRYSSKEGTLSSVEFSIGSGKLTLTGGGTDVKINDDTISGLTTTITNSTAAWSTSTVKLTSIAITWAADEDLFIAEDTEITMPGFKAVKMSYGGLNYPTEETIEVKQGGTTYAVLNNFPLRDGEADINFLYGDSTSFTDIGKDSGNKLITAASGANLTFDDNNVHDYFVVTWADTSDAESYLMRPNNIRIDGANNKTDFQYYKNGAWTDAKTGLKDGDTFSIGSAEIKVWTVAKAGSTKTVKIQNNSVNTNFYQLYSKEGMRVSLPIVNSTLNNVALNDTEYADDATACALQSVTDPLTNAEGYLFTGILNYNKTSAGDDAAGTNTTACATSFILQMNEEDKNGNKAHADGDWIKTTVGWDGSTTAEVEVSSIATETADATSTEIDDTDVWRDFTYSALATEILYNKPSSGQKSVKLIYHGDEVTADVYITSPDAILGGGAVGSMVFTDAEKSSWQGRDVILVGGSCINSATATALGVAYPTCASAWEASIGIGSGQFLIQSVGDAFTSGKIALIVAGYEKADTAAAASRLVNQPTTIDTTAGNKYIYAAGVSGTSTKLSGP